MIRPGLWFSVVAIVAAGVTAWVAWATSSEGRTVVLQLGVLAVVVFSGFLLIGAGRWIGVASLPMFGATAVEIGFADDPTWMRSIIIGALWFVTLEAGWEAIDRRSGSTYSAAATARRLQEVGTVLGLSLLIGLLATLAATVAPCRSVLIQGLVIGIFLLGLIAFGRLVAPDPSPSDHSAD